MIRYDENIDMVDEFAEMMLHGNPHFIEVKSYMHIGMSTERLEKNNMIEMGEIRSFSRDYPIKCRGFYNG